MTIDVTSPVTGGAQTGFTAPTYTLTLDTAPETNGKQKAVTALGGTQTGVVLHSGSAPFTILVTKPKVIRTLGKANPITNVVNNIPVNVYRMVIRKAVLPLAGQPYQQALARLEMHIPAGSDTADPANLRAMISLLVGALTQQSAGVGDTVVSGILG
jgi:hypothetical protein